MLTLYLVDGQEIKIKHYDYYNDGRLIGCTTDKNERMMVGTKFVKEIK